MSDLISRQTAIDAMSDTWKHICYVARRKHPTKGEEAVYRDMCGTINRVPSAQPEPTLYGYPIEHLEMIARVMEKENCTPEAVEQILQNAGEIAKIVRDEMLGMFNESIERTCKGVADEEGMDHRVGFRKGRIPDRIQSKR